MQLVASTIGRNGVIHPLMQIAHNAISASAHQAAIFSLLDMARLISSQLRLAMTLFAVMSTLKHTGALILVMAGLNVLAPFKL